MSTLPYLGPVVHFVVPGTAVVGDQDTAADNCNTDCNLAGVVDCIHNIGLVEGTHRVAAVGTHNCFVDLRFDTVIEVPCFHGVGNWWVVVVVTAVAACPDSFFHLLAHTC